MKQPRGWALATGVIAVAIVVLSSIPADAIARTGIRIWDKGLHAGVWSVLTYCLRRAVVGRPGATGIAVAAAVAFGISDELHQSFTPGRDMSGWDVVADAVGAVVGALLAAASVRRVAGRRSS